MHIEERYQHEHLLLRGEVLRDGFTPDEIHRVRRAGRWSLVRRGWYAPAERFKLASEVQRHRLLVQATLGSLRSPAVVSHVSAAVLHGLPVWRMDLDQVHVTRPTLTHSDRSTQLVCHSGALSEVDITMVNGLPTTTAARTAVDLGRMLPFEPTVVVMDAGLHSGSIVDRALLTAAAGRVRGTPGSRNAVRAASFADGRSESVGESRSRVLFDHHSLPAPELQRDVLDTAGRWLGRPDFSWDGGRVLGEFDGRVKYTSLLRAGETASDAVVREKLREDRLRSTGARVVRWTWDDLSSPEALAFRIRTALRETPALA